jgi:7tm Odorant receptor
MTEEKKISETRLISVSLVMSVVTEVKIIDELKWPILAFKLTGLDFFSVSTWISKRRKLISFAKAVYFTLMCVNFVAAQVSQFVYLLTANTNPQTRLLVSGTLCHLLVIQAKLASFLYHKAAIIKILQRFGRVDCSGLSLEGDQRTQWTLKIFRKIKIVRAVTVSVVTIALCFAPVVNYFLDGSWYRELIWKFSFPFNQYDEIYYNFVFCWMNWIIFNVGLTFFAMDMLIYGIVAAAAFQFTILNQKIQDAISMNENLSPLIDRHIELKDLVKQINNIFSKALCLNFIGTSYMLCGSAYLYTISERTGSTNFASVFFAQLIQIAILCYFGNLIESSSEEIYTSIQVSNFYEHTKKVKFGLFMISMQAIKPCSLRAWKFVLLNFPTLTIVLNTAYSYYSCIKSLKQ